MRYPLTLRRGLQVLCVTGALAMAASVQAQSPPAAKPDMHGMMAERHNAMMQMRLDKMQARLEIKASQQAAWQQFASAVSGIGATGMKRAPKDADAATLARFHADRAAEHAKRLATIADATAKLQAVLT